MATATDLQSNSPSAPSASPRGRVWPWSSPWQWLTLLGFVPLVALHWRGLWVREQYQYFPFAIGAFVYLLVTRLQTATPPRHASWVVRWAPFSTMCLIGAFLLLLVATVVQSPWVAAVAFNIFLAGLLTRLARERHVTNLFGLWLLLWLLVPLPFDLDGRLIGKLQNLSSRISSGILDLWSVSHLMSGNVLQLPDKQFFVDEACSGIISVMSVVAVGLIWAVWHNRAWFHLVTLVVLGIGWAVSLNVARISLITFAHSWYGYDLSTGTPHEMLGLALFSLTFLALISSDQILAFLLQRITWPSATPDQQVKFQRNPLIRLWNGLVRLGDPLLPMSAGSPDASAARPENPAASVSAAPATSPWSWGVIGAFTVLGLISIVPIVLSAQHGANTLARAQSLTEDFLPAQVGELQRVRFESIHRPGQSELGDYSRSYLYRDPKSGLEFTISFDFPFAGGWHELCVCYKNTGWTMLPGTREVNLPLANADWPMINATFARGATEHGYLAFSNFNADGLAMHPPNDLIFWKPWRRLRRRLLKPLSTEVYQIQVWCQTESPITEDVRDQVDATLLAVREKFRAEFSDTPAGSTTPATTAP